MSLDGAILDCVLRDALAEDNSRQCSLAANEDSGTTSRMRRAKELRRVEEGAADGRDGDENLLLAGNILRIECLENILHVRRSYHLIFYLGNQYTLHNYLLW